MFVAVTIGYGFFVPGSCFAVWFLVSFHLTEEEKADCLTLIVLCCGCLCSVSLPQSMVCDCGIFWSYSLFHVQSYVKINIFFSVKL